MSQFQGTDDKQQYKFKWCCHDMEDKYRNLHSRLIGYDIDIDKFYIHETCKLKSESEGSHIMHYINNCPFCGAAIEKAM